MREEGRDGGGKDGGRDEGGEWRGTTIPRRDEGTVNRVSYRILSWGGKQGSSRMIIVCESTLTHAYGCVPTWGVWGHAPPGI